MADRLRRSGFSFDRASTDAATTDPWIAAIEQAPHRVVEIRPCTPAIIEVWLEPRGEALGFQPGQYVLLEDDAGTIAPRSFSIANAPRADGRLSLLVTRVPGGQASTWVHDRLKAGAQALVSGPYGTFVDDPGATAPALYLAAGSGLAPIRALLDAALTDTRRAALTLVFSARTRADLIDPEAWTGRQAREPRFRFIRTLTRESGPPPRGRIPAQLGDLVDDVGACELFVAGASGFVAGCTEAATTLGVPRAQIHTEVFYAEPQPWSGQPA
jgi:CDP-4-dehydro-6-deoxyglucose reductase